MSTSNSPAPSGGMPSLLTDALAGIGLGLATNVVAAAVTLCAAGSLLAGPISITPRRPMLVLQVASMAFCLVCPAGLHVVLGALLVRPRRHWLISWLVAGPALFLLVVCPLSAAVAYYLTGHVPTY